MSSSVVSAEITPTKTHLLQLPRSIWVRCGLPPQLSCTGETVLDALRDCATKAPQLALYLTGLESERSPAVIFANGKQVIDAAATTLTDATEMRLVLPAAGG